MAEVYTVQDNLLTTTDLTRLFGRSTQSINAWRKQKELPYIRLRGTGRDTIRYDRKKILAWAKRHAVVVQDESNGIAQRT